MSGNRRCPDLIHPAVLFPFSWRSFLLVVSLACLPACLPAVGAEPQSLTGKVVAVADGDTLTVLDDDKVQHKARLHGIAAPKRKQAFGTKARERLAELTHGRSVRVLPVARDRYGRTVARVEVQG